jgi:hypothetical protein
MFITENKILRYKNKGLRIVIKEETKRKKYNRLIRLIKEEDLLN